MYAVYLAQAAKGHGMGRALMGAAAHRLLGYGLGGASLLVLDGNDLAHGFFAALGGRVILRRPFLPQAWEGTGSAFAWDDLPILVA